MSKLIEVEQLLATLEIDHSKTPIEDAADIAIALLEAAYALTPREEAQNLSMKALEVARDLPRMTPDFSDLAPADATKLEGQLTQIVTALKGHVRDVGVCPLVFVSKEVIPEYAGGSLTTTGFALGEKAMIISAAKTEEDLIKSDAYKSFVKIGYPNTEI